MTLVGLLDVLGIVVEPALGVPRLVNLSDVLPPPPPHLPSLTLSVCPLKTIDHPTY